MMKQWHLILCNIICYRLIIIINSRTDHIAMISTQYTYTVSHVDICYHTGIYKYTNQCVYITISILDCIEYISISYK